MSGTAGWRGVFSLIPPQVKWTLIAVAVASFLGMGWGVKTLYAKTVLQEQQLEDKEAKLRGWDNAYTALYDETKRVDGIVTAVEIEKDAAEKQASVLAIALEKEKLRDSTKCATTTAPAAYVRTLVDGLPSRRHATAKAATTGGTGETDQ